MAILGNNSVPSGSISGVADAIYLNQYTVSGGNLVISALHAYLTSTDTSRLVVYDSTGSGGAPGALVCKTADLPGPGAGPTDVSGAPTPGATLTNGVAYWVGIHFSGTGIALGRDTTGPTQTRASATGLTFASGPPSTFPTPSNTTTFPYTFWAAGAAPAAPVADFTGTPLTGTEPLSVAFTDTSTNTPTSWAWTFGDGGTSTSQNPTHSYTAAGTFTVALTATNATGSNTKTRTGYVTAADQPRPVMINTTGGWVNIADHSSFVSGSGAPTAAIGANGAIYLDVVAKKFYGPKAGGAWPGTAIGTLT